MKLKKPLDENKSWYFNIIGIIVIIGSQGMAIFGFLSLIVFLFCYIFSIEDCALLNWMLHAFAYSGGVLAFGGIIMPLLALIIQGPIVIFAFFASIIMEYYNKIKQNYDR